MAKLHMNNFLLLSKRTYAVVAENLNKQPAVLSVSRKAKDTMQAEDFAEKEETFWMRDPKTGNWIPETHFGETDAAELREKFLSKKSKF